MSVTYLALVDEAKYQSSHFSCKDQHDDQKELERKENGLLLSERQLSEKLNETSKMMD